MEVRVLDTFPHTDGLGPSEVIALGGFGTISTQDFNEMKNSLSPEEVKEKVREILINGIVRGYASMSTSALVLLSVKGSRVLDLYITSYPYGSYMVLSQRYVDVTKPVLPKWVGEEIEKLVKEEIKVYRELLDMGIRKEEARSVLGVGTPTHMLAVLPVESLTSMKKWGGHHREIEEFWERLEVELRDSDVWDVYRASLNAPTMGGPFPHPFHYNPLEAGEWEVVDWYWNGSTEGIDRFLEEVSRIRKNPPRSWEEMVKNTVSLSKISYTFSTEFSAVLRGKIALTTYNELKRHRTLLQRVEGIYRAMERPEFYIYPSVENNKEAKDAYSWVIEEFLSLEAPKEEALYALPQGVKVGVEVVLPLHQLTAPSLFYRMRSCDRAEISMKQWVRKIPYLLKKIPDYGEKLFKAMTGSINGSRTPLPKCVVGACPEREYCPLIKGIREDYDEEIHRKIKKGRKGWYNES